MKVVQNHGGSCQFSKVQILKENEVSYGLPMNLHLIGIVAGLNSETIICVSLQILCIEPMNEAKTNTEYYLVNACAMLM